jgi:hypothetical protein
MLMQQAELRQDDGGRLVAWIDKDHAIPGHRFDFNLGDGERSPVVEVLRVWKTERDLTEIHQRETDRRDFGGSVK